MNYVIRSALNQFPIVKIFEVDTDDTIVAYIQQAYTWVDSHLGEAVGMAYRGEREQALALLATGLATLPHSELPGDLRDQVSVRGRYLRWQVECLGLPPQEESRLRDALISELQDYHGSRYAEASARAYLLQLRALAWRDDGVPYPVADFRADLAALPEWGRTLEVYIYIATCAFLHRDREIMEECFTVFTTHSDGFMADYLWTRANLMYQLLKGTAAPRDLAEMLRRIEHPHQWTDFERVLLPACIKDGLFRDNSACAALGARLYELHATAPDMPKRLRATGRIMRD
jgi:hypothetical protein